MSVPECIRWCEEENNAYLCYMQYSTMYNILYVNVIVVRCGVLVPQATSLCSEVKIIVHDHIITVMFSLRLLISLIWNLFKLTWFSL